MQYGRDGFDPEHCRICEDERQYVGWDGQQWTTLDDLRAGHHNRIETEGPGVVGIGTEPPFAIGQRALLVEGRDGNILWDCVTLIDDATIAAVGERGGLSAIALSHPHYYSAMIEWSEAFGDVPVFVHEADRHWVGRPDPRIAYWSGDTEGIAAGITLVNCGVHFAGGTVLHWADAADGAGALLSGDIFQVVMDRRWVSFMYSYPNLIPERPETVRHAVALTEPFAFERIYGAWWRRNIDGDGKRALARSADRYIRRAGGNPSLG